MVGCGQRLKILRNLFEVCLIGKINLLKPQKLTIVPILRANNINGQLNYEDLVYVPREKVKGEQFVKALDIIIAMSSGSKHLVGKAAQAYQDFEGGFGTFCGLVRISEEVNQKFIGLFFQSPVYRNEISRLSIGININNLRSENIEAMSYTASIAYRTRANRL